MNLTAQDINRNEQRDTAKANHYFKRMGLTEEQLTMPNVNLYCKAKVLSTTKIVSHKDKLYCKQFMIFWQATNGVVTRKSKKKIFAMLNYYEQKQLNANNKLLRSKLRPNSIKQ